MINFLMKFFDSLLDNLIPQILKNSPLVFHKSRVLVYFYLLSLVSGFILAFIAFFWIPTNQVPLIPGIIINCLLLIVFYKKGNLILSGNLLALTWFLILAPIVPSTGGLRSDNLLWLIMVPIIAVFFANKKSGMIWFCILILYTSYIYSIDKQIYSNIIIFESNYLLTSYTFLFSVIYGSILIFEKGQKLIIDMLQNQKQTLQEQKLTLEQKNQEILEQKHQLEKMSEKLKETNYALEHFAATAAHDLREPLRMISMYTSLAQRRMINIPDSRRDEYMRYATDGASRMSVLLDNLLSFSRSGRQVGDLNDIDLNKTLHNVILNLSVVLKDTGASITSVQLPTLTASESDISQLFQNLIANAIKFRKDNVVSEVEIGYIERKNNHVITIKDNGIGIKQEHQTKVFAIFQRLNGRDKYDGSGIGLATCRKIVENLDGKIWLQSAEGEGTTFFIAIPKSKTFASIKEEEFAYAQ
jgi:signal transduction histidine kinase